MCCTSVCVMHQEKFSSFDYKSDRVDEFLGQFIEKDKRFSNLWTACIFVFMLAHGQSRVFNINKAMLVEGLEETSIKRQRLLFHVASKMSLFTNLLFPDNLHFPASLHAVNITLLWKVPDQKP